MSKSKTTDDKDITPAGEVELNEEELDQVSGGLSIEQHKLDYDKTTLTKETELSDARLTDYDGKYPDYSISKK